MATGEIPSRARARRDARYGMRRPLVLVAVLAGSVCSALVGLVTSAPALDLHAATTSYYENDASSGVLYRQGAQAGRSGAAGIVILDFGRPAQSGAVTGTMSFRGTFIPLAAVAVGVESYVRAYYHYAPSHTTLDVAVGTNNSCGPGQPCGATTCGCSDEPDALGLWGAQFAYTVEEIGAWARNFRARNGFTDDVRIIAADDAEPAYDPGFTNTYEMLKGYADAVGGTRPAMVDIGSAEGTYWTEKELFQVAYGLPPDVPMPQVYYPGQAGQWAALLSYAKSRLGKRVTVFGLLTKDPSNNDPATVGPASAYVALVNLLARVTGQSSIPWVSTIRFSIR